MRNKIRGQAHQPLNWGDIRAQGLNWSLGARVSPTLLPGLRHTERWGFGVDIMMRPPGVKHD